MTVIYKITSPSGRIYIGQTNNAYKRKSAYRNLKTKGQPRLNSSFIKYGFEKHIFEVIESCLSSESNNRERYWQEFYNSTGKNGLNCMLVTSEHFSGKHSEESKKKMSLNSARAMLGRKLSQETKEKISKANLGSKRTDIQKEKMRSSKIGVKLSENHKKKISLSGTGRIRSLESNIKLSNSRKGIVFSDTHIQNLKTSHGKKVIDNSTGIIYYSARYASECLGLNWNTLMARLNGNRENNTTLKYL